MKPLYFEKAFKSLVAEVFDKVGLQVLQYQINQRSMAAFGAKDTQWILYSDKYKKQIKGGAPSSDEKLEMYREIESELKQAILSENLIVLTGAGASISDTKVGGGKSMSELWDIVKEKIDEEISEEFERIKELASYKSEKKDLELLLSQLQSIKIAKDISQEEEEAKDLDAAILRIEKVIEDACTFDIPEDFPHPEFLRKLLKARKKTAPRLKIFTLNYDTSFEQAADKINAVLIDGFSFNQSGKFKSTNFDLDIVHREQSRIHNEENFFNKVLHLYKIHGSVDWLKPDASGEIYKKRGTEGESLLIYPNSSKFENSYQMPFFEMISRFQIALRTQNTTLFIVGYGFNDGHINRIINEALRTNINLKIIVINSSIKETDPQCQFREMLFQIIGRGNTGLTLIADTFGSFTVHLPSVPFPDKEEERDGQFKGLIR